MLLAVPPMVCVWLGVAEAGYLRYYMLFLKRPNREWMLTF